MVENSGTSQILCGTPVSIQWVRDNLIRTCAPAYANSIDLKSWTAELIGQRKGFVSFAIRVTLEWSKDIPMLPKSVVVKVPSCQKVKKLLDTINVSEMEEDVAYDENDFIPAVSNTIDAELITNRYVSYRWLMWVG